MGDIRTTRTWAEPEERHVYVKDLMVSVCVRNPNTGGITSKTWKCISAIDVLNKKAAAHKFVRDLKKKEGFSTTADRQGGFVTARSKTGVVGVSPIYGPGGDVVGFRTVFRKEPTFSFFFSTLKPETCWQQSVHIRFRREGRKDFTIPEMPDLEELRRDKK